MARYDLWGLFLLQAYEEYLPYMTDAEILDIVENGSEPAQWRIDAWRRCRDYERGSLEASLKRAMKGGK